MTSTKSQLERVQLTDTQIKVVMPEKILHQIQYLCRDIAKVEWSGILFYSVEGSIKDPTNMIITLEDILPMHKGTSTFTEYSFDERVVEHMMDNEHLENCKIGHIHSHNTMGVFFSGTDWSELEDNAPNHNIYLSLIVNNFMDFCAKVCFIAETEETKEFNFQAKDENGGKYVYKTENFEVKNKKLVTYDCAISSPKNDISVDDNFKEKVAAIIAKAEIKITPANVNTYYTGPKHIGMNAWDSRSLNDMPTTKDGWSRNQQQANNNKEYSRNWRDQFDKPTEKKLPIQGMMISEAAYDEVLEDFCLFVLNTGNSTEDFADIEDIVEFYIKRNVSPNALAKNVLEKYVDIYKNYFDKLPSVESSETIISIVESVIELLQHEADTSTMTGLKKMLKPTIDGLTRMCIEIENYELFTNI